MDDSADRLMRAVEDLSEALSLRTGVPIRNQIDDEAKRAVERGEPIVVRMHEYYVWRAYADELEGSLTISAIEAKHGVSLRGAPGNHRVEITLDPEPYKDARLCVPEIDIWIGHDK